MDLAIGMNAAFALTPNATEDLDTIWWFIADDNPEAPNRVEFEIVATCRRLAKHPLMGTRRLDISQLDVRFWMVTRFPNYVVVYRPETKPLQIIAILHAQRNLKDALESRPAV